MSRRSQTSSDSSINAAAAIERAAAVFISKPFRARFVHEALKRPNRLISRVSHHISDVFLERFRGGAPGYGPDDLCLKFSPMGFEVVTWSEAMQVVAMGGGGHLIIDATGNRFFADAEGEPPPVHYAGEAGTGR